MAGKIPRTIFSLVEPAVWSLAARLLILTTERQGSATHKPTVSTFYETGLITALYEALLMSPALAHLEIRHEMSFQMCSGPGAPQRVDLWLRAYNGGNPMLIEAGDFKVGKVHADLKKLTKIAPKATRWFLAFFRTMPDAAEPLEALEKSIRRKNGGLDAKQVELDKDLVRSFDVYRPGASPDRFGVALLRGK